MAYDVIVVGGNFAGLSAAMQLARARRKVLLVDAGSPRNRFAAASHGFLGLDGAAPAAIMREGLRQLSAYPSVDFVHGLALAARGEQDAFELDLDDGQQVAGRRLVLATGVRDELPLPGMGERWGRSVLHCPYCHGYEVAGRALGVIANGAGSAHQALLVTDWGPVTFFTQGLPPADPDLLTKLAARGALVEPTPVVELLGGAPGLDAVRLSDGRVVPVGALFVAPKTEVAGPLAAQLGCAFDEGMTGAHLRVDDFKMTSVPGVFAAGDVAAAMHNATLASAAGVLAGVSAHRSLVF